LDEVIAFEEQPSKKTLIAMWLFWK
jgi:hypothetical protein